MTASRLLSTLWQRNVKEFFHGLHGHQSKTLALFVLGAIRAKSIVLSQVAEALLADSDAKAPSLERRLQRFLSNERIETEVIWDQFLGYVLPYFASGPVHLVVDVTWYEEHAQVIYLGILQHSRVLPIAWKVMPGLTKWEEGFWETLAQLFERVAPFLAGTECTILGDSAFGCFPFVELCKQYGWHYVLRICGQHSCERRSSRGDFLPSCAVAELVNEPGKRFHGAVTLWQESPLETNLSGYWDPKEEEPLLVISDRPASRKRITEYGWRMRVEATFEDLKSRGWDWEESHVRRLDRVDRLLLVLFLLLWWVAHLAASCIHNGRRDRYDRHDRRVKGIFRIGQLYLLDIERRASRALDITHCLLFHRCGVGWSFSLRF